MKVAQEPVATAGAVTMLAALIVALGQVTGLWSLDTATATTIAVAVVGAIGFVGSLIARRKVTPTSSLPASPPVPPAG